MFLLRSVCLSVCLSDNWKSCEWILTKFLGGVRHGPGSNEFNFGDDLDYRPDLGVRSPKSRCTGLSKKLPTDFDEILWRAWVWPSYILVTIRITIRIRESILDHDPDPGRTATLLIMLAFGRGLCSLSTSSFKVFYLRTQDSQEWLLH